MKLDKAKQKEYLNIVNKEMPRTKHLSTMLKAFLRFYEKKLNNVNRREAARFISIGFPRRFGIIQTDIYFYYKCKS